MTTPLTQVRIAFDLAAGGSGNFFTLSHPTKGILSGGTVTSVFPLAGEFLEDITEYVRSVSISRGRSQELDNVDAGAATIVLDNRARTFDPTAGTSVSPYSGQIIPRKQIQILCNGAAQFDGQVEDWDLLYTLDGMSEAVAKSADGLATLARQTISAHTAVPQTSGQRITAILDRPEIAWSPARRSIGTGVSDFIGEAIGGTVNPQPVNALEYLRSVEDNEAGLLFISKTGILTFRDRNELQRSTSTIFADDGSGIPFDAIEVTYGTELVRNSVNIDLLSGENVTVDFTASQDDYGIITYSLSNSMLNGVAEAESLADWLLTLYGVPRLRFNQLGVNLQGLTTTQQNIVLSLELGDLVTVRYTPNNVGGQIRQAAVIESIDHSIGPASHRIEFGLSFALSALILDSATFGVLDQNTLGF